MNELQMLLGDELYGRVKERIGSSGLLIDDGKLIPKHRFDCVNVSLREHKAQVAELQSVIESLEAQAAQQADIVVRCEAAESELGVYELIVVSKARNVKAVRSLLTTDNLRGESLFGSVKKQIKRLRVSDPYLFEDCALYRLVPCATHREEKTL